MRTFRPQALAALILTAAAVPASAVDAVFVVRHLQKDGAAIWSSMGDQRPLSEKGAACAASLVELVTGEGVAAVYSTERARTLATGAAVSGGLEDAAIIGDNRQARPTRAFAEELLERHAEGRALLFVGHSNTVTDIVLAFRPDVSGCLSDLGLAREGIPEKQYGDVWRIELEGDAACAGAVTRLRLAPSGAHDCTSP